MAVFYAIDLYKVTTLCHTYEEDLPLVFPDFSELGLDLDPRLDLHFDLKWFMRPHLLHTFPKAGHFPLLCALPQNLQSE